MALKPTSSPRQTLRQTLCSEDTSQAKRLQTSDIRTKSATFILPRSMRICERISSGRLEMGEGSAGMPSTGGGVGSMASVEKDKRRSSTDMGL